MNAQYITAPILGCTSEEIKRLPLPAQYVLANAARRGWHVERRPNCWKLQHPADREQQITVGIDSLHWIGAHDLHI